MCSVPAGSFQRDKGEENISVISKPYYLGKYPITRQQFLYAMKKDPSDRKCSTGMNNPVQKVNWYHTIAFCNKLSLFEGLTPAYTVNGVSDWENLAFDSIPIITNATWDAATCNWNTNGYRLPTEMEWMWAAMGADQDAREGAMQGGINRTGYTKGYAGSTEEGDAQENIDDHAWYDGNSDGKTHLVGEKLPNELGLYDMSGNVWEWCWDKSGGYPRGTLKDYKGAGIPRALRGGTWLYKASGCAVSARYAFSPHFQGFFYGFRVLRPVQ